MAAGSTSWPRSPSPPASQGLRRSRAPRTQAPATWRTRCTWSSWRRHVRWCGGGGAWRRHACVCARAPPRCAAHSRCARCTRSPRGGPAGGRLCPLPGFRPGYMRHATVPSLHAARALQVRHMLQCHWRWCLPYTARARHCSDPRLLVCAQLHSKAGDERAQEAQRVPGVLPPGGRALRPALCRAPVPAGWVLPALLCPRSTWPQPAPTNPRTGAHRTHGRRCEGAGPAHPPVI